MKEETIMKVWWTSDTHYGANRTLELSRRPFSSTEEMDDYMVEMYNKLVQPDDICYHLGDFGDYDMVKYLNGKVILIMGNYERKDCELNFNNDINAFKKYLMDKGFYNVYENHSWYKDYKMVHEPSKHSKNHFTLFGHIHRAMQVKKFGLNVGVDCNHFRPIDLETVRFFETAIKQYYDSEVFD